LTLVSALKAANRSSSSFAVVELPFVAGEEARAKFDGKGRVAGVALRDVTGGVEACPLLPKPSHAFEPPNCASYCFLFSSSCLLLSACSFACCSCNVSVLWLEDPKETRFEKLSGVDDLGAANGEDFGAPEPCADIGVFLPES
jgi:hypothetical protein